MYDSYVFFINNPSNCYDFKPQLLKNPSIHSLLLIKLRNMEELEPIPAATVREVAYTMDVLPV